MCAYTYLCYVIMLTRLIAHLSHEIFISCVFLYVCSQYILFKGGGKIRDDKKQRVLYSCPWTEFWRSTMLWFFPIITEILGHFIFVLTRLIILRTKSVLIYCFWCWWRTEHNINMHTCFQKYIRTHYTVLSVTKFQKIQMFKIGVSLPGFLLRRILRLGYEYVIIMELERVIYNTRFNINNTIFLSSLFFIKLSIYQNSRQKVSYNH